jgi:DNA mismatch repair protein MutL
MSDVIKLLPDSVANQIAAGEVIQRPAAVVKELVENAVDAGATDIKVIVKDAGRTLIQVVDNGSGMSATDARLAFERHSTSKITKADDLFALHTMGFRGEALASICAVAHVDLRTMRRDDTVGTRIVISGSHVDSQEPEACNPGSNMMVKDLFYNVPARRKFLKSDNVEMSNIIREFERMALVNPTVELTLVHNDVTLYALPKANLKQRIVALFGKALNAQLVPVETDTDVVRISGFVVRPENCKKRGWQQFFFVNGRNMTHPVFHQAVMQCYEELIPADCKPTYFIDLNVDPQTIDVNIHPTKHQIKFEHEQVIRQILYAAVKETLGRFSAAPTIDFANAEDADAIDIPAMGEFTAVHNWQSGAERNDYNPFAQSAPTSAAGGGGGGVNHSGVPTDWEALYRNFAQESSSVLNAPDATPDAADFSGAESQLNMDSADLGAPDNDGHLIGVGNRYIAAHDPRGLRIIDVRRAHIAILYEQFMHQLKQEATAQSQRLFFPEQFTVAKAHLPMLQEIEPQLALAGFDIASLGDGVYSINAIPVSLGEAVNAADLLTAMVHDLAAETDASASTADDDLRARTALALARNAAIRADRQLTAAEMQHLMADLMSLSLPGFTPDGHPTFVILTASDIEKLL